MSCCLFALAFVRSCLVCLTCDVWIKRIHQIGTNLAAKTEQPTALCRPRLYSWHFDGVCKRRCRKRFSSLSNPWSLFFSDFSSFWMSKWSCVCVKWWTTIRNGIKLPLILSTSKLSTRDTSFSPQNVHLFRSSVFVVWCLRVWNLLCAQQRNKHGRSRRTVLKLQNTFWNCENQLALKDRCLLRCGYHGHIISEAESTWLKTIWKFCVIWIQ